MVITKQTLKGKKFGRLTVIRPIKHPKSGKTIWECQCDCGKISTPSKHNLTSGTAKSCGCIRSEMRSDSNRKHGLSSHPLYGVWKDMMSRCYRRNATGYKYYGGRGVKVCARWHDVCNFISDMEGQYQKGLQLDKDLINPNSKLYSPENCKFVTPKRNNEPHRKNKFMMTWRGETKHLVDWCDELYLPENVIRARIYKGWSNERALTTKVRRYARRTL